MRVRTNKEKAHSFDRIERHLLAVFLILFLGIFSYSNSVENSFHFDDKQSILENPSIRSLNPKIIWSENNHFRFNGHFSFALNYFVNGLDDIRGWHYVNIAFHIMNALILYWLITLMMNLLNKKKSKIPVMAALLFAVHPVLSEPVNYIQARHVLFYTFFTFWGALSALAFMKSRTHKHKVLSICGMLFSILLGSLSKEVGIFYVPAAIALVMLAFGKRSEVFGNISKGKIVITGVIVFILFIFITNEIRPFGKLFSPSFHPMIGNRTFLTNLLTQAHVFFRYISLLFPLSSRLNVDHTVTVVKLKTFLETFQHFIPFFIITAAVFFAIFRRKKDPCIFVFILLSIIGVLPYMLVSGSSQELMVEYKIYLSSAGFFVLIAIILERLYRFFSDKKAIPYLKQISIILFAGLIFLCVIQTRARNRVWKSGISLWSDAMKKSPQKFRPYYNLGVYLLEEGQYEQACQYFRSALKIMPSSEKAHNNLGFVFINTGEPDKAIFHFKQAVRLNPGHARSYFNLGNVFEEKGDLIEAELQFSRALEINPDYEKAYYNLGRIFLKKKEFAKAEECFKEALRLTPQQAGIYVTLGISLSNQGKTKEAVNCYNKAIFYDSQNTSAYINLGNIFARNGEKDTALIYFLQALKVGPYSAKACYAIGQVYCETKREKEAVPYLQQAVTLAERSRDRKLAFQARQRLSSCYTKIQTEKNNETGRIISVPKLP